MSSPHIDLTPLEQAATAANEMYLALTAAGFNEDQAMWLVLQLIKTAQQEGQITHGE